VCAVIISHAKLITEWDVIPLPALLIAKAVKFDLPRIGTISRKKDPLS